MVEKTIASPTLQEILDMLVILVGNSKKDKLYAIISVDKAKAFNKDMVRRLKACGVPTVDIRGITDAWTEDELLG